MLVLALHLPGGFQSCCEPVMGSCGGEVSLGKEKCEKVDRTGEQQENTRKKERERERKREGERRKERERSKYLDKQNISG